MSDPNQNNANSNGMWLSAYRSLLGFAVIIIIGMLSYFGQSSLERLNTMAASLAVQANRLDNVEGRLTNAEMDLRSHDVRINESASRIRLLEQVKP